LQRTISDADALGWTRWMGAAPVANEKDLWLCAARA
jgi:hypothetical protein